MSKYRLFVTTHYLSRNVAFAGSPSNLAYCLDELGELHFPTESQLNSREIRAEAVRNDSGPPDQPLTQVEHEAVGYLWDALADLIARDQLCIGVHRHEYELATDYRIVTFDWIEALILLADVGPYLVALDDAGVYRTRFPGHKFVMRRA